MFFLVSAAFLSFSSTSLALRLVVASTSMSSSSSRRLPVLEVRRFSRLASSASRVLVFWFTSFITSSSCSSRAFCSLPITLPRSCSSRPSWVTVKSTTQVLAWSSGEKLGLGSREMKYMVKRSTSISIILSDTFTRRFLPRTRYCRSRTGSNMGSTVFSTCCRMRAIPSAMAYSSWSLSLGWDRFVIPKYGVRACSRLLIQLSAWPCGSMRSG
mmetsp:Transcript_33259/g.75131  ORF Transcript_33259/g.75131 Transcript_33259/m.75131 type:complete len:213 (+) Transcript_33259:2840-3478(+)